MKLLFENANKDYDGFKNFIPALIGSTWVGLADVPKEKGKELVKLAGVSELSDSDWDWYKKKLTDEAIAYRSFGTVKQEPERNPNASYAAEEIKELETGSSESSDNPKDLIEVDEVEVSDPTTEEDEPKPKGSKEKKKNG